MTERTYRIRLGTYVPAQEWHEYGIPAEVGALYALLKELEPQQADSIARAHSRRVRRWAGKKLSDTRREQRDRANANTLRWELSQAVNRILGSGYYWGYGGAELADIGVWRRIDTSWRIARRQPDGTMAWTPETDPANDPPDPRVRDGVLYLTITDDATGTAQS